jgi:hypothetical protein
VGFIDEQQHSTSSINFPVAAIDRIVHFKNLMGITNSEPA